MQLDLDRAVPCGLIVIEAGLERGFKHAFPDGRAGRGCALNSSPSGTSNMSWWWETTASEKLPADLDDHPAPNSLDLQLVDDLTQQLHGNILVNRDGGTTFTITFDTDRRGEPER